MLILCFFNVVCNGEVGIVLSCKLGNYWVVCFEKGVFFIES